MNNNNQQEDQFGSEQEPQQQKNVFSSNVRFGRGFWENLSSYQKRKSKDIERNQILTPYIKRELLENLEKDLEKEVIEQKKEMEKEWNKQNTDEQYLAKLDPEAIIARSDISIEVKTKAIYFNENYASKNKFFILTDFQAENPTVMTLLPSVLFREQAELNTQINERNAQLEYPLGETLDADYKVFSPRIKKIYSYVNPNATLDFIRFYHQTDFFNQKVALTPHQYKESFEKSSIFHRGAYTIFSDIHDTIFRRRSFDYKHPTLHYTWDRNPFKYFIFSSSFYRTN